MEATAPHASRRLLWLGAALLIGGLAMIVAAAELEQSVIAGLAWRDLVIAVEASTVPEGALALRSRRISETNLPLETQHFLERVRAQASGSEELLEIIGLSKMERLFMVDAEANFFAPALASGRLPEAGKPEVLAGSLARFDVFEVDHSTFHVVGRVAPMVPGAQGHYFLPAHPTFEGLFIGEEDTTRGWMDPEGLARFTSPDAEALQDAEPPRFINPLGRLPWGITAAVCAGLILVAAGGAIVQMRLLLLLAPRAGKLLGPCLLELKSRTVLLLAVHVILYGALFAAMAAGYLQPHANWHALHFAGTIFSEGELGYIGRAYASGNIPLATLATLHQNYLMGTCLYTVVPSLLVPFAGLFKNLLSFSFVGFVMAPLWTGMAAQNTYHSITLTLELEAYVVVTFAVCALPLRVFRGLQTFQGASEYVAGVRVIGSAVVLAGIMLTIAAVYEATTLILLN